MPSDSSSMQVTYCSGQAAGLGVWVSSFVDIRFWCWLLSDQWPNQATPYAAINPSEGNKNKKKLYYRTRFSKSSIIYTTRKNNTASLQLSF